jgi:hypothetical protein
MKQRKQDDMCISGLVHTWVDAHGEVGEGTPCDCGTTKWNLPAPDPREAAIRELCDAGKEVIEQAIDFDCGCDECTQIRDRFIAALAAVGGKDAS